MSKDVKKPEAFVREVTESTLSTVQELQRDIGALLERLSALEVERSRLEQEVEQRTERMTTQFALVERQNADLAGLYVASYRLHESLEREEVLGVIQEVLANLVGSEEIAVYELSPDGQTLNAVRSSGVDEARLGSLPAREGLIGRAVASGAIWAHGEAPGGALLPHEADLTACIPLTLFGRVTGLIAVFRLLKQKAALTRVDKELFELLSTHAATALYCAGLHARASRPTLAKPA